MVVKGPLPHLTSMALWKSQTAKGSGKNSKSLISETARSSSWNEHGGLRMEINQRATEKLKQSQGSEL